MKITVNGESREIPENTTAIDLLSLLEMQNDKIAMEVNMEIVPRSQHSEFRFSDGDKVEIVRAIGGG